MKPVKGFEKLKGLSLVPHLPLIKVTGWVSGQTTTSIILSNRETVTIDWEKELLWRRDGEAYRPHRFTDRQVRTPGGFLEWLGEVLTL